MRPENLQTKIFLDSGDARDTQKALDLLGFLDGQTTNPSLITKNAEAQERLAHGEKFTTDEVQAFYKKIIGEIVGLLGERSISVEVSADCCTKTDAIIAQAREMHTWADHPHIKIPITTEGLKAGHILAHEGIHLNYTLNFSQAQAAAVHAATIGATNEQVYISPFHGRLDDSGVRGADVIDNIARMYHENNSHVNVLVASVRDLDTFLLALATKTDIITAPLSILEAWAQAGKPVPESMPEVHGNQHLASVPYEVCDLTQPWESFDIHHTLTDQGIEKFVADWEGIIVS